MGIKDVTIAKGKKPNLSVASSNCVLELKYSLRYFCPCVLEFLCAVNGHLALLTMCFLKKTTKKTNNLSLMPSPIEYTVYFYSNNSNAWLLNGDRRIIIKTFKTPPLSKHMYNPCCARITG